MFEMMGTGPIIAPWTSVLVLAWQSPTTGVALLACLTTLLLTGFFLVTRGGHRYAAGPLGASPASNRRLHAGRADDHRQQSRSTIAA